jgi:hypothetical protein
MLLKHRLHYFVSISGLEAMEKAKKLYMENFYIMKENERLRKQAQVLNEENQVLLAQLKQRQLHLKQQGGSSNPNFNTPLSNLSGSQGDGKN